MTLKEGDIDTVQGNKMDFVTIIKLFYEDFFFFAF